MSIGEVFPELRETDWFRGKIGELLENLKTVDGTYPGPDLVNDALKGQ
jgi:hypothetical protein